MRRRWPQIASYFICIALASPVVAQQAGVQWQQDLEVAKAQARQTGRLVLVHFWTPECVPCAALEQNVFNQGGVGTAMDPWFVPVKLNANDNQAIAEGLGITRVPMDVIMTAEGTVVGRLISPPSPGAYISEVTQVARAYSGRSGQRLANAPNAAPEQAPPVNAAYAGLQLAPQTPPAIGPAGEPAKGAAATGAAPVAAIPVATTNQFVQQGQAPAATAAAASRINAPSATTFAPPPAANVAQPPAVSFVPPASPVMAPQLNPQFAAQQQAGPVLAPITPITPVTPAGITPPQSATFATASAAAAPPTITPDAKQLPAGAPPLGFDGYCPVTMRNNWKWVSGNPQWGIVHRGRTYWFASQSDQQQFWTDPDRYAPALSGMDPVMAIDHQQQVPGKREHSIDYDNLFYMFASEATLQQFTANPERYAVGARQAMGIPRGRLVR